jgi:putative zinc finger protein
MQHTAHSPVVTPSGVRAGDRGSLAALCERRGASVLAYCTELCADHDAAEQAAAEAFARFRAAVVAIDDVGAIDPEALLLSATRHAAASLAPDPAAEPPRRLLRRGTRPSEACRVIPELLVARAEGTLGPDDQALLTRHLERCSSCSALRESFRRAEQAYREPADRVVPPEAATTIVAALVSAAPVAAPSGEEVGPRRGRGRRRSRTVEFAAVKPPGAAEEPPVAGRPVADEPPAASDEPPAIADEPPAAVDAPPAIADEPPDADEHPPAVEQPAEEADAAASGRAAPRRRTRGEPADQSRARGARRGSRERHLPAAAVQEEAAPHSMARPRRHPHPPAAAAADDVGRLRSVVMPGAIVAAAITAALVMAGVFGDEGAPPGPASSDQLFPTGVIRAPERGTAADAAAEIARQARMERLRIARERAARRALGPAGATSGPVPAPAVPGSPPSAPPAAPSAGYAVAESATGIPTPVPTVP